MRDLAVSLVQTELAWEAPADNRRQLAAQSEGARGRTDLIVLPEMFTTGFSMNALGNAESEGGETEAWMMALARRNDCAVTGSIAVRTAAGVANRMLFATAEGVTAYDKRHLFRMAGEHKRYLSGRERVIVHWRDWRILLQVCYDLRFPVFSRNRQDYDLAVFVANWPAARAYHWRSLLLARAIENQACVIGVNRIGRDANGLSYQGDSMAFSAEGRVLADLRGSRGVSRATLCGDELVAYRERFPCHLDADQFELVL